MYLFCFFPQITRFFISTETFSLFLYFYFSYFSGKDRIKRSTLNRKTREVKTNGYKFLEGALIVPKSYEEKYGTDKFATVLLAIANMVCLLGYVYDEKILILS